MAKKSLMSVWTRSLQRSFGQLARSQMQAGTKVLMQGIKAAKVVKLAEVKQAKQAKRAPAGRGDWLPGAAIGLGGARQFRVYRPPGMTPGERLPLLVMLHGCGQTANAFAKSTRMNALAARERCLVLYPEQDRLANPQGCWNWFASRSGKAQAELGLILQAIDQVCRLYGADPQRVAVAGLSAGASMAALLASRHPERFKAVVMHSGVPPGSAHSSAGALAAMAGRRPAVRTRLEPGLQGGAELPPLLVIHGRQDGVVALANAHAAVQIWAECAGAAALPARGSQRGRRYGVSTTDYKAARLVARLVEVDGLGHAWSGGAKSQAFGDPQGPDASRMVWQFVREWLHPRREGLS